MFRPISQTQEKMSFEETVARFLLFPAFVSPPLYVLETLVSDIQFKRVWFSAFRGNSKVGIGLISAYLAGLIKGGSCGVKEPLAETYEMVFCAPKHIHHYDHHDGRKVIKGKRPLLVEAAVPISAAFLDTWLTNPAAVTRFRAYDHKDLPSFTIKNIGQVWNYSMAAFWSRAFRANVGLAGLMYGKDATDGIVNKVFPEEKFGTFGKLVQCAGLGGVTSLLSNPPDYLWKRSMLKFNETTYKIPPYRQTIAKIIREQGSSAFMRGTLGNSGSFTALFLLVEGAEYVIDNVIFPKKKTPLASNSVFRHQPASQMENQISPSMRR